MDPNRADLWEITSGGNRQYLNTPTPVHQLCKLSNTDANPILSKRRVVRCDIKHIRKLKHIFGGLGISNGTCDF